ncbi:PAS domain S-box-containing protein [Hymenobacter gelipurpurascens]|uniref:histidine kinase n=1 Tax=Hymenobacter gelipurpurascens TaxID=89968 RepID=A0A212UH30_9BACT|nr:PAS domain-containing protein [Hymenobacter gelipurpurascens]SNC77557.1 PAS domain S-box-containing protein [Hymenobacter gelipurpurascens]
MPVTPVPLPLRSLPADQLLGDLLAVSMTGVIYYTPLYDPAGSGQIVDFTFEYLNPTAQRMMRMPEVPTRTHNEQWPHSIAHGTFDFHVDAFVSGESREYNINYQADGYDNYYRLAARRSGDGLLVSFTDTADQPRSPVEVALREAQTREQAARTEAEAQRQRLHHILMELPAKMATLSGPELTFALVSPGFQQLFPARAIQGLPIREALPELVGQPHLEQLNQVYRTGEPFYGTELETWVDFAGTGQPQCRYFNVFFQALRDANGHVDGVLNFAYDVTEQVEARQQLVQLNQELESRVQSRTLELQESESRFRIMADAAPNQVWAVNPDSTMRYANQAFLDFVGVSLEQYVATGWAAFLPADELELAQTTLETAIRTRSQYILEHRLRRHDGQYRWLLAQGAPSFYPNGDLYGYVGSAIDITELKQTNQRLTRTNQDLDNFVYAASHDLKQPVNNLVGLFTEMRRSSTFADPAEEELLVPLVQEALQQLGRTIDDLATLGEAQQTAGKASAEEVSLADLTEEVVNTLEPQVRAARARITVDFAAWPTVAFARANLRTILLNLLSNALKYADPARPARIHVSVWADADQPVLVVKDNGLGFDAARYGPELFHLFRRFHHHTTGSGVGLYLVNRIVQASGGGIEVDSQEGEGATFRIRLGRG